MIAVLAYEALRRGPSLSGARHGRALAVGGRHDAARGRRAESRSASCADRMRGDGSPSSSTSRPAAEHRVVDGHNDLLWAAREKVGYDFDRLELTDTETCQRLGTHTDLPRLRAGGVGAQFWSVFVPATLTGDAAVTATLEQIDGGHAMIRRYADQLALATTVEDVEAAWQRAGSPA